MNLQLQATALKGSFCTVAYSAVGHAEVLGSEMGCGRTEALCGLRWQMTGEAKHKLMIVTGQSRPSLASLESQYPESMMSSCCIRVSLLFIQKKLKTKLHNLDRFNDHAPISVDVTHVSVNELAEQIAGMSVHS